MDYKKYSLENLKNWLNDAMSAGEATPEEIYNTIKSVVEEQYYYHKHNAGQAYELLALLNGNGVGHITNFDNDGLYIPQSPLFCDPDDSSKQCKGAWNDFWGCENETTKEGVELCKEYSVREAEYYQKGDKVVKWQLPVNVDGLTGECYINLPDDLLEVAGLKEGDRVEWVDLNNGSFEMRKVNGAK